MKFETNDRSWWGQISRSVREFPVDLAAVLGLLVLVNVVYRIPGLSEMSVAGAQIQPLIGIPTLLFLPGYVLVALLFPGAAKTADEVRWNRSLRDIPTIDSIDFVERIALSFGMSIAFIPIFALALGSWWDFTLPVALTGLTAVLVAGVVLAAIVRLRLPTEDRYGVSIRQGTTRLRTGLFDADSGAERIVNLVLVLAILTAVGAVGYAVATPYESGDSSLLYLASENETGVQTASGYPTNFTAGEAQPLTVGVKNDEERRQPYTVVVTLERVETDGTEATVVESTEIDRLHTVIPDGESATQSHNVVPTMVGDDLRLHYYLYKGESAPSDPGPDSAYRDVYIWIDVNES